MWSAIQRNYSFLSQSLAFSLEFLSCLYEQRFISKDEFVVFRSSYLTQEANVHRLLVDILPSKPMVMFPAFCNILRSVGQSHVAEMLEQDITHEQISSQAASERQGSSASQDAEETLTAQVARLEREKTAAVRRADEEKLRSDGVEWTTLALRYDQSRRDDERKFKDSLPSWTQWNVHIPHDSRWCSYGRMVETEGRLVVAVGGDLHVLTGEGDKWDMFVRKKGNIRRVVCHQGVCLVCVKDYDQDQFVIEQFNLNGLNKWRFLTVLPNELQLLGLSVALHDNTLYVVGGGTKSGKKVSTAQVYDLHRDYWSKMDDMQTERSHCSSVVINNTVFVGGGYTDRGFFSNTVECADVRVREWRKIPSTTNYRPTLTAVSNRLVVTGGETQQWNGSFSALVELYDERLTKWLHLPPTTEKRCAHAALSTHSGELITAGGWDEHYEHVSSIESLKF